jgi:hypothetical protein
MVLIGQASGMPLAQLLDMPLITGIFAIAMFFFQKDLLISSVNHSRLLPSDIRIAPLDTLSDLAVSYADPADPVIYINPRLMRHYGPDISAFVLVHEQAHIMLGHQRPAGSVAPSDLEQLLQGWELEADCLAASMLVRERPSALSAAREHFRRMGTERIDREHPTGRERALRIDQCARAVMGR